MPEISPSDRDMMIRTIIGEAGNEPALGQVAVAHAIMNRLGDGNFGKSPTQIVLAPGQFEPWQTRSGELATISRNSPAYQQVGQIVDGVVQGGIPDPTKGATHFLNEDVVRQRRGGALPDWAQGPGLQIGAHTFHNPKQKMAQAEVPDYLKLFSSAQGVESDAKGQQSTGDVPDYLKIFSERQSTEPKVAEIIRAQTDPQRLQSLEARNAIPVHPQQMSDDEYIAYKNRLDNQGDKRTGLGKVADALDAPGRGLEYLVSQSMKKAAEHSRAGLDAITNQKNWLPSFESVPSKNKTLSLTGNPFSSSGWTEKPATDLSVKEPGKILGGLGGLLAPVAGVLGTGEEELKKITGNPGFAEKAMILVPTSKGAKIVNEARPSVKVLNDIAGMIPDRYLPEAVEAAKRNPSLAPVDLSRVARERADMIGRDQLAPKAQQEILNFVDRRKGELEGDLKGSLEVLGELPDPHAAVTQIKQRAADTGKKIIEPIVKTAKDADVTGIVNDIDKIVERAKASKLELSPFQNRLAQLREELRGDRVDRDQMFREVKGEQGLHWLQSSLRQEADDLIHSAVGSERTLGQKLYEWRNKLVDSIDAQNPGYKEALGKFREDKDIDRALAKGMSFMDKTALKTPEDVLEHSGKAWSEWAKNATPDELSAVRLGSMIRMMHETNSMRGTKAVTESPKNPVLSERIGAIFDKDTAKQFTDHMRDVHRKTQSVQALDREGSQTFQRLRAAEASPVRVPGKSDVMPGTLQAIALGGVGHLAELAAPLVGAPSGMAALTGMGLAGARMGYSGLKHGFETIRYKNDLARRLHESRRLTTPISQQSDLAALLDARIASLESNSGLDRLLQLSSPSPMLAALPR